MFYKFLVFAVLGGTAFVAFASKIALSLQNNKVQRCPGYEDHFFDKFVTLPENMTFLPDERLYVYGNLTIIFDFKPDKNYNLEIDWFYRSRGTWQSSTFAQRRADLCRSVFDPKEVWYSAFKKLNMENWKCPLKKGDSYRLNGTLELIYDNSLVKTGSYWFRVQMGNNQHLDDYFCADFYVQIYRF